LRAMPHAMKRVQAVKLSRQNSKSPPTQKLADTPTRFHVEFMPQKPYMVIPEVSSERRDYIPLGYLPETTLASNKLRLLPEASLYQFGVLSSRMHMAWTRYTCGRLESRYQYSITTVYNNFPWPTLEEKVAKTQKNKAQAAIESAAQTVLDARAQFPGSSLADLYDPLTMPPALVKAHQKLDAAVDAAYAQDAVHPGKKSYATDAERVAYLFALYQRLTSLLPADKPKKKR
jgi:hypothetical protein